jgi:hypothetical protein
MAAALPARSVAAFLLPFEPASPSARHTSGAIISPARMFRGTIIVKIVKTTETDPIPLRGPRPHLATIMVRFLMFLTLAIAALLLAWGG